MELTESIKSKDRESETYISEIEVSSQFLSLRKKMNKKKYLFIFSCHPPLIFTELLELPFLGTTLSIFCLFFVSVMRNLYFFQTIGQAYEDMQTQNQHLLQQMTERDDYNIKVHRIVIDLDSLTVFFFLFILSSSSIIWS